MGSVIKFFKETYGKPSIWGAVKAGGWRNLFDGNHAETMLVHTPGSKVVGSDDEGNKYYENMSKQIGRHRWVVFTRLDWATGQDPTRVPASWHDENPTQATFPKAAIYGLPHKGYVSGTAAAYKPKGAWENPLKRNWKKVSVWQP